MVKRAARTAARTTIGVEGARVHNLKNISLEIPRDSLIVVTGLSGSGKSSLAFDTIYAEGQRRYVESLSAYARQFLEQMAKPDIDSIEGLSPAIVPSIVDGIASIRQMGHAVLIAESNLHHVPDFADRLYVIERGEIIYAGPPAKVREDPAVARVVDGSA